LPEISTDQKPAFRGRDDKLEDERHEKDTDDDETILESRSFLEFGGGPEKEALNTRMQDGIAADQTGQR